MATAPGSQSIGSLKPGEKVWAYNTKTQKMELEPVLHVWINHDDDLVDLTISTPATAKKGTASEVLHTNKKHPFLTEEQGFVPVSDLHVGMHVREANGSYGEITGWYVVSGTMTMYNLEVQQDHTYTVGDGQWVVHNSDCDLSLTQTVANHFNDEKVAASTVLDNGATIFSEVRKVRPYMQTPQIIAKMIMESGKPVADAAFEDGSKWVTSGFMNGKEGSWELVINNTTNTIAHLLFKRG